MNPRKPSYGMDPLTVGQLIATLQENCDDLDTVDVYEGEHNYIVVQQHNDTVIRLEIQTS